MPHAHSTHLRRLPRVPQLDHAEVGCHPISGRLAHRGEGGEGGAGGAAGRGGDGRAVECGGGWYAVLRREAEGRLPWEVWPW